MKRSRKKPSKRDGVLPDYEYPSIYSEEFFSEVGTVKGKKGGTKKKSK